MPTVETTNINFAGSLILQREQFRDEVLNFAAGATVAKGTILARVTATNKVVPFAVGGAGGAGTPVGVLSYEVSRADAGDVAIRMLVAGEVNRNRLIIAADGHGNNITPAILDQLRAYGIVPVDVQSLATHTV